MLSRRIKYTLLTKELANILATHPNYYILMKLGNIMRVEILNLSFSIKDSLKIVSKTKTKNCWSTTDKGLHCA